MTKPTKPTVPLPPLRSQVATFSERLELSLLFWPEFATYLDESADYVDERADEALAAALGGDLPTLSGNALKYLRVNAGATAAEFVDGLASPAFTGTPTAPTAAWGTDTTQIATMAAVQDARTQAATPQATTSGSAITFSSIPAGVQRFTILYNGVSVASGGTQVLVQLGVSGTPVTTGYDSKSGLYGSSTAVTASTSGFIVHVDVASRELRGTQTIDRFAPGSNTWVSAHNASLSGTFATTGGGTVGLAGEVNAVRITTNVADTFDAGEISLRWE